MPASRDAQQQSRAQGRDGTDGNPQRLQGETARQQDPQYPPARHEGGFVIDGTGRISQLRRVVGGGNVAPEIPQQHAQRGSHAHQVDRHHHRGVLVEADFEVIRRDDIDQVRHHQRQARGVGNEAGPHHKCQGRRR